ncbi:MAG: pyruvate dehydrogenase complex dihydrolipoamide acetyltransferase [Pontixanthobacter sp.]
MPIPIKMPALSPTMEEGTLAKWLVAEGDSVSSGDIMAEIETDKATMEFEAVDEGIIAAILVKEGSEGVEVGTTIAMIAEEGEDVEAAKSAAAEEGGLDSETTSDKGDDGPDDDASGPAAARSVEGQVEAERLAEEADAQEDKAGSDPKPGGADERTGSGDRIIASPLARRIAEQNGVDLSTIEGSGPNGRIVKADVDGAEPASAGKSAKIGDMSADEGTASTTSSRSKGAVDALPDFGIPHDDAKLGKVRKVIAKRLTEAKRSIPHIYLTVDVRLDALLDLRSELNTALEAQEVKLSVNDLLIKGLAKALAQVPQCNVAFGGETLRQYSRQDISVAVAAPDGLITPIVKDAGGKAISQISTEMKALAAKARDGKLQPDEYQGGTASLSNLGMFGIKQFDAVINPPQAMIMAVGAGEKRACVIDGELSVATIMSATGSFDHRAIDGVDGAKLMDAFKNLIERPLALIA